MPGLPALTYKVFLTDVKRGLAPDGPLALPAPCAALAIQDESSDGSAILGDVDSQGSEFDQLCHKPQPCPASSESEENDILTDIFDTFEGDDQLALDDALLGMKPPPDIEGEDEASVLNACTIPDMPDKAILHESSESERSDDNLVVSLEKYPTTLLGRPLFLDEWPKGNPIYRRLKVSCNCTGHINCEKSRNIGRRQTSALGFYEPVAFLGCWLAKSSNFSNSKEHVHCPDPTLDEQREWLLAHPQ